MWLSRMPQNRQIVTATISSTVSPITYALTCRYGCQCISKLNKNTCQKCDIIYRKLTGNGIGKGCYSSGKLQGIHISATFPMLRIRLGLMNRTKRMLRGCVD